MNPLSAQPLVDLSGPLEGWPDPVSLGVDSAGDVWAVARRSTEALTQSHGIGIFPKSRLDSGSDHIVVRWSRGELKTLRFAGEQTVFHFVQPFPGGVLMVGARCRWRPEGAEKNALALDWSGNVLGRWTLGDGIEDLRVTPNGTIWASYFDEGVFGNYGWSSPGPEAIGSAGLVAFDPNGERCFDYDAKTAGTDTICDAYAMNVAADDDVWVYFYTEFPIVRIHNRSYQVWKTKLSGARALAIKPGRALLVGGYKQTSTARVVELGGSGTTKLIEERILVDEQGTPLAASPIHGVGDRLYVLNGRSVQIVSDW
jgi:hypothetical protein